MDCYDCSGDNMKDNSYCDPETGLCVLNDDDTPAKFDTFEPEAPSPKTTLHVFTDPICSACFIIEDDLQAFIEKHKHDFNVKHHMGGLVPNKDSFNDPANGIHAAKDVAKHWREMGDAYGKTLNVDMWEHDPMDSSIPPSLAYLAALLQDEAKANQYLIDLRSAVFVDGKNIEHESVQLELAQARGLDTNQLLVDIKEQAPAMFQADKQLMREFGVRGFPTLVIENGTEGISLNGIRTLDVLERFYDEFQHKTNA